jgi:hypothetical protein
MEPGEIIPIVKKELVELTLWRHTLRIWVFFAEVTDEFILGLNILQANDALMDLERQLLRLGQEVMTLWNPGALQRSSGLTLVRDGVFPTRYEREVTARIKVLLGASNVLV